MRPNDHGPSWPGVVYPDSDTKPCNRIKQFPNSCPMFYSLFPNSLFYQLPVPIQIKPKCFYENKNGGPQLRLWM